MRRLLAFGRNQPLQITNVDLNAMTEAATKVIRQTLGDAIRVEFLPQPLLWPARADASQAADVLLNLALNARDAMPHGGVMRIATAYRVLDAKAATAAVLPAGDYVSLAVTDAGFGMTAEVLEHALEPFFTTKADEAGAGPGLSTSYGFARQSGGTLTLASVPGAGTTATLLLPRGEKPPPKLTLRTPVVAPGGAGSCWSMTTISCAEPLPG